MNAMNTHNKRMSDMAAENGSLNAFQQKEHDNKNKLLVEEFLKQQFSYLGQEGEQLVFTIMHNFKLFKEEPMNIYDYQTSMLRTMRASVVAQAEWNKKLNAIYRAMFKIMYPIRYEKTFTEELLISTTTLDPVKKWLSENREELTKQNEWNPMELLTMFNKSNNSAYTIQRFIHEATGCFTESKRRRVNGKRENFTTIIWDVLSVENEIEEKKRLAEEKRKALEEARKQAYEEKQKREEDERPALEKRYKLDEQIKLSAEELIKLPEEEFAEVLAHFENIEKIINKMTVKLLPAGNVCGNDFENNRRKCEERQTKKIFKDRRNQFNEAIKLRTQQQ